MSFPSTILSEIGGKETIWEQQAGCTGNHVDSGGLGLHNQ